jgi:hypothetical protein
MAAVLHSFKRDTDTESTAHGDTDTTKSTPLENPTYDMLSFLASFAVIAAFTFALSYFFGGWGDLIARGDTAAHMTKVQFILDNWPRFRWGDIWAAGFPMFLWYAPLPYLILTALAKLVGSIQLAFSLSVDLAVALIAIGGCLIAYENGASHADSLLVGLLIVASPASWAYGLKGGLYPRLLTLMFWPLSLFLVQKWVKSRYTQPHRSKVLYVAFVLVLAAGIQGHVLVGSIIAITVALFLILTVPTFRLKIESLVLAFAPALGLSAVFYLPFFLTNPASRFLALRVSSPPLQFQNLIFDSDLAPYDGEALFPLLLPLFVVLFVTWLRRRGNSSIGREAKQVLLGLLLVAMVCLAFAFAGHFGWPSTWYINGFPPGEASIFLTIVLAVATGILLRQLGKRRRIIVISLLCMTLVISVGLYSPLNPHSMTVWSTRADDPIIGITERGTVIDSVDVNYRYGTDWDRASIWFNYIYPIPQTRDYYGQGVLIEDWRFWYEKSVWVDTGNYNETNYVLDWLAVKWFSVSSPHYHSEKFLTHPAQYRLISNISDPHLLAFSSLGTTFSMFEYVDATQILSATNAPAVLVIGNENAYSVFFRSLAYTNFGSEKIVPIQGSEYIDDYTPNDLANFDAVVLYGYQYHDKATAFAVIEKYVQDGGSLIVDTGLSPQAGDRELPEVFPVASVDATNFGRSWTLSAALDFITSGVRFEDFSPAIYGADSPWGVSAATNSTIRPWANPLVFDNGRPIVAVGQYGKGRVAWSGMNLPYHAESYKNSAETSLLVNMLKWATYPSDMISPPKADYVAVRENAEIQTVQLNGRASGVLLKESFFDNWNAYVIDGTGVRRQLEIYEAGPSFMYVRLRQDIPYPARVVFEYGSSWPEYFGDLITVGTLILLAMYLLIGDRIRRVLASSIGKERTRWERDD